MRRHHVRARQGVVALACALVAHQGAFANPVDTPTAGMTAIYVDIKSACQSACGAQTSPHRNIKDALALLKPGQELVVAGYADAPYYPTVDGLQPADNFAAQQFVTVPQLEMTASNPGTGPSQSPAIIRGWQGMAKPLIRGTLKFGGWQAVAGSTNLYAIDWKMVGQGLASYDEVTKQYTYPVVGPQQVYRGNSKLQQVGGLLYNLKTYEEAAWTWPTRTADRTVGRITPQGAQPWLNLAPDQFYYDPDGQKLYVRLSSALAANELLEASVQQFLFWATKVHNLTVKDLVFERSNGSAYSPQNVAVAVQGNKIVLDGITVQDADAIGLIISGDDMTLRGSTVQRNGQMGLASAGARHTVSGNTFTYNNAKGYAEDWAAGGIKILGDIPLSDSTFSGNVMAYNYGDGIWLDTNPQHITIDNNVIAFNGMGGTIGIGVHLEVSGGHIVKNNKILGNANHGIQIIGGGNLVYSNLLVANGSPGISQLPDYRVKTWTRNTFQGNTFAWNHESRPAYAYGYNVQWLSGKPVLSLNGDPKNNNQKVMVSGQANAASFNTYCATSRRWQMDSASYFSLPAWQKLGGTTPVIDLFSTSYQAPYPRATSSTQPPELGDLVDQRSNQLILDASSGALATYVKNKCK
ncbi:MAG TPA: right-handed parallel beta-helix repeat-containing protein [Aquabacterium sp.]|uniref:right-handed parallel beta-helix repeat-containing protein n=1 Tax=Aquabacterium sp. TaxID=1872578 RepID=UPI002E36E959|nr:right-handed parallel beta-helix repeat-containing protein [Aquabacterium sp.]HEX5356337.1 right-handed parallel beta-helix repeat-containing protein [Aquabacterium sp.]